MDFSFIQVLNGWVMTKMVNYDGDYWWIVDNKRDTTSGKKERN